MLRNKWLCHCGYQCRKRDNRTRAAVIKDNRTSAFKVSHLALPESLTSGQKVRQQKSRRFMQRPTRVLVTVRVFLSVTALLIANVSSVLAQTRDQVLVTRHRVDVPPDIVVKAEHISLLKTALNLTPAQEPLWAPVEAALHEMARWQASRSSPFASVESPSSPSEGAVVMRLRRIAAMAAPLLKVLDENQRNSMMMLARTAGLDALLVN
jgi:hypothetical protein